MNARLVVSAVIAAALLVVAFVFGGWIGLGAVFAFELLAVGIVVFVNRPRRPMSTTVPEYQQPRVAESVNFAISTRFLRSAHTEFSFQFAAAGHYQADAGRQVADLREHCARRIVSRAEAIAARFQPEHLDSAADELRNALAMPEADVQAGIKFWADGVSMTLSDADKKLLQQRAEIRNELVLWKEKKELERAYRDYLQNDALATPSNAVVWWLANQGDKASDAVRNAVELRGILALLSSAARSIEVPSFFAKYAAAAETTPSENFGVPIDESRTFANAQPFGQAQPASTVEDCIRQLVQRVHPDAAAEPERALLRRRLDDVISPHRHETGVEEGVDKPADKPAGEPVPKPGGPID